MEQIVAGGFSNHSEKELEDEIVSCLVFKVSAMNKITAREDEAKIEAGTSQILQKMIKLLEGELSIISTRLRANCLILTSSSDGMLKRTSANTFAIQSSGTKILVIFCPLTRTRTQRPTICSTLRFACKATIPLLFAPSMTSQMA